jgi:hypothetical protein
MEWNNVHIICTATFSLIVAVCPQHPADIFYFSSFVIFFSHTEDAPRKQMSNFSFIRLSNEPDSLGKICHLKRRKSSFDVFLTLAKMKILFSAQPRLLKLSYFHQLCWLSSEILQNSVSKNVSERVHRVKKG